MDDALLIAQGGDSLREAFGKAVTNLGHRNQRVVVLDADVAGGTGAHHFRRQIPERFVQCGIAEQNMVGVAAGLAGAGFIPFVTSFATFLLRSLEQARLSIAYSSANVKIVASHAGLDVGPDGASAQCLEDLAAFRTIPGFSLVVPATPAQIHQATLAIASHNGPVYMRTGRSGVGEIPFDDTNFSLGKASTLREGNDLTIIACGRPVIEAVYAADALVSYGIQARVLNMATIKPIDKVAVCAAAVQTGLIVTVEDHNIIGGLGSAVAETVSSECPTRVIRIGIEDSFGKSGEQRELYEAFGIDRFSIFSKVRRLMESVS